MSESSLFARERGGPDREREKKKKETVGGRERGERGTVGYRDSERGKARARERGGIIDLRSINASLM